VAVADRHASRVNEEDELPIAKGGNPLKPLYTGCDARGINGAWWEAVRGEGEAAAAGAVERFLHNPSWGVKGCQVCLEHKLELDDRSRRMGSD